MKNTVSLSPRPVLQAFSTKADSLSSSGKLNRLALCLPQGWAMPTVHEENSLHISSLVINHKGEKTEECRATFARSSKTVLTTFNKKERARHKSREDFGDTQMCVVGMSGNATARESDVDSWRSSKAASLLSSPPELRESSSHRSGRFVSRTGQPPASVEGRTGSSRCTWSIARRGQEPLPPDVETVQDGSSRNAANHRQHNSLLRLRLSQTQFVCNGKQVGRTEESKIGTVTIGQPISRVFDGVFAARHRDRNTPPAETPHDAALIFEPSRQVNQPRKARRGHQAWTKPSETLSMGKRRQTWHNSNRRYLHVPKSDAMFNTWQRDIHFSCDCLKLVEDFRGKGEHLNGRSLGGASLLKNGLRKGYKISAPEKTKC